MADEKVVYYTALGTVLRSTSTSMPDDGMEVTLHGAECASEPEWFRNQPKTMSFRHVDDFAQLAESLTIVRGFGPGHRAAAWPSLAENSLPLHQYLPPRLRIDL
ncbi:hypothetical protein ColTof4_06842 [Colletotrichum tofieldiae]|nr:hypothetical protein ColTof3_11788 [Colletotrichum tofieldiae]GKT74419.1 hypothetical protein ColTof4_06842 [Colletotrichum tofieldiae]